MGARPKFTADEMARALRATHGVYYLAAAWLKDKLKRDCSANTVRNHCRRSARLAKLRDEVKEDFLDRVEGQVYSAALRGNLRACQFILSRQGRHRGWSAKLEVTAPEGLELRRGPPLKPEDLADRTSDEIMAQITDRLGLGVE